MLPVENASLQALFSYFVHVLAHSAARLTTGAPLSGGREAAVAAPLTSRKGEECIPLLKASHTSLLLNKGELKTTEA